MTKCYSTNLNTRNICSITIFNVLCLGLLFSCIILLQISAYPYTPYGYLSATQPVYPVHIPPPRTPVNFAGESPTFYNGRYGTNGMGVVNTVPYDPNDSFTNYDYEETSDEDLTNDPNAGRIGGYRYDPTDIVSYTRLVDPAVNYGYHNSIPHRNTISLPIKPYDYYAVYRDETEDDFDGVANGRWTRPTSAAIAGRRDEVDDDVHAELGADGPRQSNMPLGRVYGHHHMRSDLRFDSHNSADSSGNPGFDRVNVHIEDVIRPRGLFSSPYFPGLQRQF